MNTIEQWLENQLSEFPQRAAGEELYERMARETASLLPAHRSELVQALSSWLQMRAEPRTMLAIHIAAAHHLSEVRGEIEAVLRDVQQGRAFKPHYGGLILGALARL